MSAAGEYLAFVLGTEEYALDIGKVREIRAYAPPTRIAGWPEHMKGVIDLRGAIVPIVDLRIRNGATDPRYDGRTVVIILELDRLQVGIVVDAVTDVVRIDASELRPLPALREAGADYLTGLAALEGRMLGVIDAESLFRREALPAAAD